MANRKTSSRGATARSSHKKRSHEGIVEWIEDFVGAGHKARSGKKASSHSKGRSHVARARHHEEEETHARKHPRAKKAHKAGSSHARISAASHRERNELGQFVSGEGHGSTPRRRSAAHKKTSSRAGVHARGRSSSSKGHHASSKSRSR